MIWTVTMCFKLLYCRGCVADNALPGIQRVIYIQVHTSYVQNRTGHYTVYQ